MPIQLDDRSAQQRELAHSRLGVDALIQQFLLHEKSLPGSALRWLASVRQQAIASFGEYGWPTPKREDWKFTNLKTIFGIDWQIAQGSQEAVSAAHPWSGVVVQVVNGWVLPVPKESQNLGQGVWLESLRNALDERPQWLGEYLGKTAAKLGQPQSHPLRALNTALFQDGVVLHVADGVQLEQPIHVVYHQHAEGEQPLIASPRLLVVLGKGSAATVVEHHLAADCQTPVFSNGVSEFFLAENAELHHYKLQEEAATAFHVGAISYEQQRDSRLHSLSVALGAAVGRTEIDLELVGPGAEGHLLGFYWGQGKQLIDHTTVVQHRVPHCTSEQVYRGILDGASRGVFNGKIVVAKDAQKTDSLQSNKNLLLSKQAKVDTRPQLEVYADDVKCAHGAAVGQLNEDALFYLRQRGIGEREARAMLTFGFAKEVLDRIHLPALQQLLGEKLHSGGLLAGGL